ncbi:hypothetical protein MNBD_GAMMA13-1159 [hydrothermal vent metagenome]|uniref:Head decoration protein n=1 Tax=hydrothermal vent metagenome TaxID=652676 RepID=A0A3B0ZMI9_9ZZZZ
MALITEPTHPGEFIVSEANGDYSREAITVLLGEKLVAGAVVGAVNTGTAAAVADSGNTGDGTMGAITVSGSAQAGDYRLTFLDPAVDAGAFVVEDAAGISYGTGDVAAPFSGGGLSFTLADGAVDFVAGDAFTITVTVSATKYKEYDPTNTDGSEVAGGVLFGAVDASTADAPGVLIARDAEVNKAEIIWFNGATAGQIATGEAQLETPGIVAR